MGGYLHPLDCVPAAVVPLPPERPKPKLNVTELMRWFKHDTKPEWLEELALELNVSYASLIALECAWAEEFQAWAFPMCDGFSEPIGIRLRLLSGKKISVIGSHNGIFEPNMIVQKTVLITEGESDCAAAISLGFYALGRPGCSGAVDHVCTAIKRLRIERAVIVADNDADKPRPNGDTYNPGVDGSIALQKALPIPSIIFIPPSKDLRSAFRMGLTKELILSTLKNLVWKQPL